MNIKELEAQAKALAPVLKSFVARELAPLQERIDQLERDLHAVDQASLKYAGTFSRTISYTKNTMVTRSGSLWVALRDSPEGRPGQSDHWLMIDKAARHD